MRSYRRSYLTSFFYGVLIATGTAGGLMGTHMLLAPPAPDQDPTENVTVLAKPVAVRPEVATSGVEKWARSAQPAPKSEAAAAIPRSITVADAPAPAPKEPKLVTGPMPASGEAQRALTRNIQRELKRVGCYSGEVTGDWSSDTRSAMKSFNDTVRVQFPVAGPDYILLTLLQGQSTRACGTADPTIMAKVPAPRQVTRQQVQRDPTVVVAEPRTVTVVQPRPATGLAQIPPAPSPSLPVIAQPEPLSIPTAAPLPGRMAIGGPAPRPDVLPPAQPPVTRAAVNPSEVQPADLSEPRLLSQPRVVDRRAGTPPRPAPQPRVQRAAPGGGSSLFTTLNRAAP